MTPPLQKVYPENSITNISKSSPLKSCARCHVLQPAESFVKDKNRKDGLYPLCKICIQKQKSDICPKCQGVKYKKSKQCADCLKQERVIKASSPLHACSKCHNDLPASLLYFARDESTRSGLTSWCRDFLCASTRAFNKKKIADEKTQPTRTCKVCGESKLREEFHEHSGGRLWTCKTCKRRDAIIRTHKNCSSCSRFLSLDIFYRNKKSVDGRGSVCKECRSILGREERGLPRGWYEQRMVLQNEKCAICCSDKSGGHGVRGKLSFHVDHNHSCCPSNRYCEKCIRGLLCDSCNKLLGHLENIKWLKDALSYLHSFGVLLDLRWVTADQKIHPTRQMGL